jgi:hypothetical protein
MGVDHLTIDNDLTYVRHVTAVLPLLFTQPLYIHYIHFVITLITYILNNFTVICKILNSRPPKSDRSVSDHSQVRLF